MTGESMFSYERLRYTVSRGTCISQFHEDDDDLCKHGEHSFSIHRESRAPYQICTELPSEEVFLSLNSSSRMVHYIE